MDHFGIGAAVRGATEVLFMSARQSGRTTSLIESLHDGDRVCFVDARQAEIVARACRERGLDVLCMVLDPKRPTELFRFGTSSRRTILDHSWVEQYYRDAIERASREIDHYQREASGDGAPHVETRRAAVEIKRWPR